MQAAVVRQFDRPPRFEDIAPPVPTGEHEGLIDVLAAGLHPRVRSQADGSHYTSTGDLPLVPGIDGVGRRADGSLVYFVLPDTTAGSMAERTVIDARRSIPLPDGVDAVLLAAAMNPAMSSWVALQRRTVLEPGQSVLVLGATGSAGQLAVQIAKHLGASRVVGAGRNPEALAALPALGADAVVDLTGELDAASARLAAVAADVDVVLDYLWGPPAESLILPLLWERADRSRALAWIQIGSVAGPDVTLPSAALRQANISFLGSGQGSVSASGILSVLPALAAEVAAGSLVIDPVAVPLSDVEQAWTAPPSGPTKRLVLCPGGVV